MCSHNIGSYSAFGLSIASEVPLPELVRSSEPAEVHIRFGALPLPEQVASTPHWVRATPEEVILHWAEIGTFLIRGGHEIIVAPCLSLPEDLLRLYLLGSAMGVLLCQRGLMVFHASAAAVHGRAVAFLGDKGWGKSTMALALHAAGHPIIADDLFVAESVDGRPMALPGFPRMKLWPDSIASIGVTPEAIPRLYAQAEKRNYHVTSGFCHKPMPLQALYVLDEGERPVIEPILGSDGLLELIRHWYCSRFGTAVMQRMGYGPQFLQCAQLANRVPVYRLRRPRLLATLPEVAQLVENHILSLRQPERLA